MASYAYKGAAWNQQAQQNRAGTQQAQSAWSRNAPQYSQLGTNRMAFMNQQQANQARQRNSMFGFAVNALGGLMR